MRSSLQAAFEITTACWMPSAASVSQRAANDEADEASGDSVPPSSAPSSEAEGADREAPTSEAGDEGDDE